MLDKSSAKVQSRNDPNFNKANKGNPQINKQMTTYM